MARRSNGNPLVAGHCPQGCGETLFVGEGGHITCSWKECPAPTSVDELLGDVQNTTHVVNFDQDGSFAIQHPIRERLTLGTELYLCPLHEFLRRRADDPLPMGRYRATEANPIGWDLGKID